MLDLADGEQLPQGLVLDVDPRVVCHEALGVDATVGEPVECSRGERGHRCCSFVAEQLDVGQAGVIIDDCVSEVIARARTLLSARSVANPGHGMTWTLKARMACSVHVQQISRARPLIAPGGLTR